MLKKLLTKSLLVAAGLCVGSSAWADVTPFSESYSSTSTTTGWSTGTSERYTPVILNDGDDYYLSVNQNQRQNNGATVTGEVVNGKAAAGDDFTITFDMKLSSSNNQSPTSFKIQDAANKGIIFSITATGNNVATYIVNGTSMQVTLPNGGAQAIASCVWCSYKITRSGSDTYLTVTNKATSAVIFSHKAVAGTSATGGLGKMVFASSRYNANFAIDNIVVREVIAADIPSTYTALFTDNTSGKDVTASTTIYSDSERNTEVANGLLENGTTYYYTATKTNNYDYQGSFTVSGANPSISFSMTSYPTYKVNAVAGGLTIEELASGYCAKDNTYECYMPYVIEKDSKFYVLDDNSTYKKSYTMGTINETKEISYTLDEDIVCFKEAESLTYSHSAYGSFSTHTNPDYSNGGGTGLYQNAYNTTDISIPAGVYEVTLCGIVRNSSKTVTTKISYSTDKETWEQVGTISYTTGTSGVESKSTIVTIPSTAYFRLTEGTESNANNYLDYILIKKAYISAPVVSTTGYATLSSTYALDFTGITTLTAYTATSYNGTSVTLTPVTGTVAANTGLVIKGATTNIPVAATGDEQTGNLLKPCDGSWTTLSKSTTGTNYVLSEQGDPVQAVFAPIGNTSATLRAGVAYLYVPSANPSKLRLVFADDDATAINSIESEKNANNGAIYNLAGQRVGKDYKGIVIKNGKKFMNK